MSSQIGAGAPAGPGHRVAIATTAAIAVAGLLVVCTPAQAHGVHCGDTITQDTTLHRNLTNCDGDGLVIGADDITLDLNGHTIDGDKTGGPNCQPPFVAGAAVSNSAGHDGIAVVNGTLKEFGTGVGGGFGRSLMRNLTVRDNRINGIDIGADPGDNLDDNRITHNVAAGNGCDAIKITGANNNRIENNRVEGGAISLIGANRNVVRGNVASGSTGAGIFGFDAKHNRIERNAVSHSQDGIFLYFSRDNVVRRNAAWANFFDGVSVIASSGNLVSENATWDNAAGVGLEVGLEAEQGLEVRSNDNVVSRNVSVHDGISVLVNASDRNRIVGNRALDPVEHPPGFPIPGGYGIVVDGGSDNVMAANTVERPALGGIRVQATPDWGGVTVGNALRSNVVRDAGGDGIFVAAAVSGTLLEGNLASGAAEDGIDVESPASGTPPTTLTRNRALSNASLGIRAGLGVTDGGGNRARGNGDPAQCTSNIACG